MTLDLVLLGLVIFFALWGAFTGVARQLAQLVGAVAAWLVARPLGDLAGPALAKQANLPLVGGIALATFLAFLVVFVVVRGVLTVALRRILSGKEPGNRGLDRTLGLLLGGVKVAAVIWFVLCTLTFVEDNVQVMGRRLGLSPKDSTAFALARRYNLFELTQFAGAGTLKAVLRAVQDPARAGRLKENADYQALRKDPRLQRALDQGAVRKALEQGDTRALLGSADVISLLQDPTAMRRMERLEALIGQ